MMLDEQYHNWRSRSVALQKKLHNFDKLPFSPGGLYEKIFLGLAISGEAGELANKIKKYWRDGLPPELIDEIKEEAADVQIYLYLLSLAFNFDLEEECNRVYDEKLLERWGPLEKYLKQEPALKTVCGFKDYKA